MQASVNRQYTNHSALAVSPMRAVKRASFIGPGVSALYSSRPPTPSSGSTATASTMMPMPPNHCSRWRHKLSDGAVWSRSVITVAPVVVSADMVSKKASVNDMSRTSSSGMVAMAAICTQAANTSTKPSRARNSR